MSLISVKGASLRTQHNKDSETVRDYSTGVQDKKQRPENGKILRPLIVKIVFRVSTFSLSNLSVPTSRFLAAVQSYSTKLLPRRH